MRAGRASPRGACASPYQIDRAVREFGFPMGPFQVVDLAGGDIGWATR
ncbi:3-hydroxyacyl-CoA dehydrogenase family protein, partial [Burkholderia multivorans]